LQQRIRGEPHFEACAVKEGTVWVFVAASAQEPTAPRSILGYDSRQRRGHFDVMPAHVVES
jgi:hypothetical protein